MAGGGSTKSADGKKKARIEIIPLIDVIFFLLATFVLFTLTLNRSEGLHVELPQSRTGEPRDPTGSATVTVREDGTYAWNKDPVDVSELETRLQAFHQQHPDAESFILINGDQNAFFYQAIFAFDEARKAGIQKVKIETLVAPTT